MNPDKPFRTDGCSDFLDGDWRECCVKHDRQYWMGGTKAQRLQADIELRKCVAAKGHKIIARMMFIGVRVGGHPLLPFDWRWGYGWNDKGYRDRSMF